MTGKRTLFGWELRRLMTPITALVVAVLFLLSAARSVTVYGGRVRRETLDYEAYVNENCFGPITDELVAEYAEKYEYARDLISNEKRAEMSAEYTAGNLTQAEFFSFLEEAEKTRLGYITLGSVYEKTVELDKIRNDTGVVPWLIPTENLGRMLGRDINVFLLAALVVVFSRVYSPDYAKKSSEGSFASILSTTKRGRRELFHARLASALTVSLIISALFVACDVIIGVAYTPRFFDVLGAPASSITALATAGGLSVGSFFCIMIIYRLAACLIITLLLFSASYFLKKVPPTLFAIALVTLLPYVFVYIGFYEARYIDITAALAGGKLIIRSAEMELFGSTFGFACALLFGWLAIAVAATIAVRQKTGK